MSFLFPGYLLYIMFGRGFPYIISARGWERGRQFIAGARVYTMTDVISFSAVPVYHCMSMDLSSVTVICVCVCGVLNLADILVGFKS